MAAILRRHIVLFRKYRRTRLFVMTLGCSRLPVQAQVRHQPLQARPTSSRNSRNSLTPTPVYFRF
ncbi:MAG: hypothetical protein WCC22_03330 [Terriglobales bacterium]